jgi:hypothetical protein
MPAHREGGRVVNTALLRAITGLAVAGGMVIGLSACTSGSANHPGKSRASSSSAGPAPAPHGIPKSAFADLESFTGPAVTKYGLAPVQAAYEEMVNFIFETGWNATLIRKNSAVLSRADFAVARAYMTPAFRKAFDATFAKVVTADKAAIDKLEHAVLFGVKGTNGAKPTPDAKGHLVTDRKFSRATLAVDHSQGFDRLSVSFSAEANIQMRDAAGTRYALPSTRILRYWLVPNAGADAKLRPFLIDSWAIRLTVGKPPAKNKK